MWQIYNGRACSSCPKSVFFRNRQNLVKLPAEIAKSQYGPRRFSRTVILRQRSSSPGRGTPNEGPMQPAGVSGAADECRDPSARKGRGPQDDKGGGNTGGMSADSRKAIYLETFGYQRDVRDSGRVAGTPKILTCRCVGLSFFGILLKFRSGPAPTSKPRSKASDRSVRPTQESQNRLLTKILSSPLLGVFSIKLLIRWGK